ncbi:MAG: RNA-binding protein [Maricaulaceae bacterium]|nr:RNA-binding protein [Maricaulaceae bacterium]
MRARRCAASGEVKPETALVRLALAPDGGVIPDLTAKLPGRGVWVSADRAAVDKAAKKGLIARAAGRAVAVPTDLADRIEALLRARALSVLGLARRAGGLAAGFDAARLALKAARPAWRIEASDAAADGRGKLDRLARAAWGEVPVAGCFDSTALGAALGRENVMHAVLAQGPQARAFATVMEKLSGFTDIDPGRPKTQERLNPQ